MPYNLTAITFQTKESDLGKNLQKDITDYILVHKYLLIYPGGRGYSLSDIRLVHTT
jgi:hypothetical protein